MSRAYKDIIINTSANLIKSFLLLISIRLAAELLAPAVFGIIMLARRMSSTAANFTQLGMSQAIQRYIPLNELNVSYQNRLRGCILAVVLMMVILIGVVVIFGTDILKEVVYPNQNQGDAESLLIATYFLTVGITLSYVVHSFLISEFRFYLASIFETSSTVGLFLLIIIFFPSYSADWVLWLLAISTTIFSLACFSIYFFLKWQQKDIITGLFSLNEIKKILAYGIPRGLSATLEMATLLIGPWMLRSNPKEAGALIIALTLLRILQPIVTPASKVLGLHAVRNMGRSEVGQAEKQTLTIFMLSVVIATIAALVIFMLKSIFLDLMVGDSVLSVSAETYLNAVIFFMPAAAGYYCMRNVVEVRWRFPFNFFFLITILSLSYSAGFISQCLGASDINAAIVTVQFMYGGFGIYAIVFSILNWKMRKL